MAGRRGIYTTIVAYTTVEVGRYGVGTAFFIVMCQLQGPCRGICSPLGS